MRTRGPLVALFLSATMVGLASSQPPPGGGKGKGPPRFEIGRVFPPPLRTELKLTAAQEKELAAIEVDLKARLDRLLTDDQKKALGAYAPRNPGGPAVAPAPAPATATRAGPRLILHGALSAVGDAAFPFAVRGDAVEGALGDPRLEHNGGGVRLFSAEDRDADGARAGEAACVLTGLRGEKGRWYRVRVRGLAQGGFAVDKDDLFLKVEFFKDDGKNPLDFVKKSLYPQVERDRTGLADPATAKNLGPATWRNYTLDVRTPFPEVDTLRVAVGFGHGVGKGARAEFWLAEVEVMPIPDPADYAPPAKPAADNRPPALKDLVGLGGRWYYDPRGGSKEPPKQFDHSNADRLLYLGDRLAPPFAGNTSAWLRRGYLDHKGDAVDKDQLVTDSLVVSFTARHLVVKSKNLPNHPTAVFPDRSRFLDGNPNLIQEQRDTWHIPLEPKEDPNHVAMDAGNRNRALTVGPIGVAVNGVVFNNPYDIEYEEAIWRLDRCCGHPSPRRIYHYHKYPACVNTPWADDGAGHSPLIGFAFDGFPVYGPYEAAGVLAKDAADNPLNAFNLHADAVRGPHYHVTPGRFPHILGGFWGVRDTLNAARKKGPPKE